MYQLKLEMDFSAMTSTVIAAGVLSTGELQVANLLSTGEYSFA